jgi:hypothetical protein
MLQLFTTDVGKVDQDVSILRDVADVFKMLQMLFQNVADVVFECCIFFLHVTCNMTQCCVIFLHVASNMCSKLRRDFFHLNKFDSYSTDLTVAPDVRCCNINFRCCRC